MYTVHCIKQDLLLEKYSTCSTLVWTGFRLLAEMYAPGGIPDLSQLNLSCFSIEATYKESVTQEVEEGEKRANDAYVYREKKLEELRQQLARWKNETSETLLKETAEVKRLRMDLTQTEVVLATDDEQNKRERLTALTEKLNKHARKAASMQFAIENREVGLKRHDAAIQRRKTDTRVVDKWFKLDYTSYPLWETPEQDQAAAPSGGAASSGGAVTDKATTGNVPLLWIKLPTAWEEGMLHSKTVNLKNYLKIQMGQSGTKWGPNKWTLPMSFAYALQSTNMEEQAAQLKACEEYLNDKNQRGASGELVRNLIAKWTAENDSVDEDDGYWSAPHMMMDYYMLKNVGLHTLGNAHMHVEQNFKWEHEYTGGSEQMWTDIASLYNLCLRAPRTPIPILVVRTIRHEHRSPTEWFKKLTKNPMRSGDSILTPTFLSTALVDLTSSWYSHGPGSFQEDPYPERPTGVPCCSIQIAIPMGFPILYLADAVGNEHQHEKEVLIPPGIRLVYCGTDNWEEEPSHTAEERHVMNFSAIFPDSVLNSQVENERAERTLTNQLMEEQDLIKRARLTEFGG